MKQSHIFTAILVMICIIGVSVEQVNSDPKKPPGRVWDVNVLNTPVDIEGEVTGDVNVLNEPTVDARQSGEWRMGTPSREPYRASLIATLEEGTWASPSGELAPEVPEGKQAVLEFVSVLAVLPAGQNTHGVGIYLDGFEHHLPMTPQGSDRHGRSIFVASQSLRAYIRHHVSFALRRDQNDESAYFEMAVSGYLIDDTP